MDENTPTKVEVLAIDDVAAHSDSHTYRTYPFEVPAGTTALALTFDVTKLQRIENVVVHVDAHGGTPNA